MIIRYVTKTLSDGSDVIDVILSDDDNTIVLHACGVNDASDLVVKLVHAITQHTVNNVVVS